MGKLTSPGGILTLITAGLFDIMGFVLFLVGTWFGIDDYFILDIIGFIIVGGCLFVTTGNFLSSKSGEAEESAGNEEKGFAGSGNAEDWKQNKEGVYELDKKTEGKPGNQISQKVPEKNTSTQPSGIPATKSSMPSAKEVGQAIATGDVSGLAKKTLKRFLWTTLIELIPFIGGFYPGWTILVWRTLKD